MSWLQSLTLAHNGSRGSSSSRSGGLFGWGAGNSSSSSQDSSSSSSLSLTQVQPLFELGMAKEDVKARLAPIPVYTVANPKNEFVLVAGEVSKVQAAIQGQCGAGQGSKGSVQEQRGARHPCITPGMHNCAPYAATVGLSGRRGC